LNTKTCRTCGPQPRQTRTVVKYDLASLPLAMAYVPNQTFYETYDYAEALDKGTLFPSLCLPFGCYRGAVR